MSLNILASGSELELQPGENVLSSGNTADLELRIPATMAGPKRTDYAKGRLWATNQRVIFVGDQPLASGSGSAPIASLVIPYPVLVSSKFNLPLLSANNITLSFLPDPLVTETNLPSPGRGASLEAKLVVGEGAGHGVWKVIEGERARWEADRRRGEEEALPVYEA
ncbi:uncharacterized protein MKK02DRAFT_37577 [Dioszegia hungarica]|uniref:Uncharacterized protein n=1 Tax=Dioszegia hungarica TaxID=4972 RepID=A0AA38H608_9TREE|nr:uncharacterized protein MKK02DRAFT_37577 [Dioszegia hungarica]KAI9634698.1 hypothetical protein MKK02DRAFT_37577 [Dioszegia hungarica]